MASISETIKAKRIEALLLHSKILSGAIGQWTDRIDKIRGIYLTALFGLVGFLLAPNTDTLSEIVRTIKQDETQISLILILPILNSILLIYTISYMHFILSAAKYNSYYILKLIQEEVEQSVVPFDDWDTSVGDKEAWVTTRSLVGILMFIVATIASLYILHTFSGAGIASHGGANVAVFLASVFSTALSITVGAFNVYVGKNFRVSELADQPKGVWKWYLLPTIPLTAVLYFLLVWL